MLQEVQESFWTVSKSAQMPAPSSRVWQTIASPSNLELCHPFVDRNPVQEWPGARSRDVIYYYSGMTFYREFCAWEQGRGYDLLIGPKDSLSYKVFWRVRSHRGAQSSLTITVRFETITGWQKLIYWLPLLVYFRPLLAKYLDSVVSGFHYHITTGQPVPRNCFGALRVFSPAEDPSKIPPPPTVPHE